MKTLPVLTHPTPSLRERSVEVDPKSIGTPEFQAFLEALTETMFVEDGIGIASPQVGRNIRVFIVNHGGIGTAYINPLITKTSDATVIGEEGCLSVPGVWGMVERAKKVTVEALDRHARKVKLECKGLEAVIFQHELDHLDGILFIDKVKEFTKGKDKLKV
ncbi:peptide deformylase [Candidatus Uhrbacteria bacterium]|nr:peptide deformylase [Candidatus Uhrbacteria bacterium]